MFQRKKPALQNEAVDLRSAIEEKMCFRGVYTLNQSILV